MTTAKRKGSRPQPTEASRARAAAPVATAAGGPLDRFFGLSAARSSVATELRAGLATFLTMAFLLKLIFA